MSSAEKPPQENNEPQLCKAKISRRQALMYGVGAVEAGLGLGYVVLKGEDIKQWIVRQEAEFEKDPAVSKAKKYLLEKYDISISSQNDFKWDVYGSAGVLHEYKKTLARLILSLANYPTDFIKKLSLDIGVYKNLQSFEDKFSLGKEKYAAGLFHHGNRKIYLNSESKDPQLFDHELFHLIDGRLNGHSTGEWEKLYAQYCSCNPHAVETFGAKTKSVQEIIFPTLYARKNAKEDRAEIGMFLMNGVLKSDYLDNLREPIKVPKILLDHYRDLPGMQLNDQEIVEAIKLFLRKIAEVIHEYTKISMGGVEIMDVRYFKKVLQRKRRVPEGIDFKSRLISLEVTEMIRELNT